MEDEIMNDVETETTVETFDDETTEEETNNSGLIGAVVGGVVVAAGAAVFNAIKKHPKVQEFVENRKEARRQKNLKRWIDYGVKQGFVPADDEKTEE